MYSLDQVIYFLEQRQQTEDWNIRDAAISYLKGYREVLPEYAQMKLDVVKNDPLTWDELKGMEDKPVWVEVDGNWYGKFWAFVEVENDAYVNFYQKGQDYPEDLWKRDIGKTWKVYRKERS